EGHARLAEASDDAAEVRLGLGVRHVEDVHRAGLEVRPRHAADEPLGVRDGELTLGVDEQRGEPEAHLVPVPLELGDEGPEALREFLVRLPIAPLPLPAVVDDHPETLAAAVAEELSGERRVLADVLGRDAIPEVVPGVPAELDGVGAALAVIEARGVILEGRVGVLVEEDGPRGEVDLFALLEGKLLAGEALDETDAHLTLGARGRDPALEGAQA